MASIVTHQNERWDTLSQRVFGRPDLYAEIWAANPDATAKLRYAATLPAGLTLQIPTLASPPPQVEEVPPWRK